MDPTDASSPSDRDVADRDVADRDVADRLELALDAAREAGRLALGYFGRRDLRVERKEDDSPVTIADREAELLLRHRISARFPADAIVGEELEDRAGETAFRWILDPIDGTKSFVAGVPLFATLVGIERDGVPVAGVIVMPALDEAVWARAGGGAWHARGGNPPARARVSATARLADALLVLSSVEMFPATGRGAALDALVHRTRFTRTWGDAYGYLLVATGRADVMLDPIMNVWDAAPLLVIVAEAGGAFTDWQGVPTIRGGEGVAANRALLAEVLAVTRGYPRGS